MFMINYELVYGKRKVASGHAATASVPCTPQVQIIPVNNPVPTTETNQTAEALSALTVAAKSAASTLSTGISRLGEKAAETKLACLPRRKNNRSNQRYMHLSHRNQRSNGSLRRIKQQMPDWVKSYLMHSQRMWHRLTCAMRNSAGEQLPSSSAVC